MKTFVACLVICSLSFLAISALELPTCPASSNSGASVCRTSAVYTSACLDGAREACKEYGYRLCSLEDLAAAYDSGVRSTHWGLLDVSHRDAQIHKCEIPPFSRYEGDECFVKVGPEDTWHIANTPRPATNEHAFCCKNDKNDKNDSSTATYQVKITIEKI
ncbi:uncharacterized protein LOC119728759 [Patiria miniata]|uniref:Uncharacterized protein n=1 Tax=Patiria miniata TaxID=46514 RepID=A0A913ZZK7_PATMI|nr:uncharacterized protein LOC119728759 [Patiria miniata]